MDLTMLVRARAYNTARVGFPFKRSLMARGHAPQARVAKAAGDDQTPNLDKSPVGFFPSSLPRVPVGVGGEESREKSKKEIIFIGQGGRLR